MKLKTLAFVFFAAFFGSMFLASCLNEDNKIPPNCYDGILNNGEQLIDCGGPCEECNHCIDGIWQSNLGETCVDCGGECGACSQCGNCIQDGDETGIDCGGSNCGPCILLCGDGIQNGNEEGVDCGGACEACPTCDDELMNGDEIGIDCGGPDCDPCATDGNCTNGLLDGDEFWVDCGGTTCPGCDTLLTWKVNGITHIVPATAVSVSFAGGTLEISGPSLQGGLITILLEEPATGWMDDVEINLSEADVPNSVIVFQDELGDVYSSGTAVSANATVSIVRFIDTSPGFTRGAFNGNLFSTDGTVSVSLTNGVFQVTIP